MRRLLFILTFVGMIYAWIQVFSSPVPTSDAIKPTPNQEREGTQPTRKGRALKGGEHPVPNKQGIRPEAEPESSTKAPEPKSSAEPKASPEPKQASEKINVTFKWQDENRVLKRRGQQVYRLDKKVPQFSLKYAFSKSDIDDDVGHFGRVLSPDAWRSRMCRPNDLNAPGFTLGSTLLGSALLTFAQDARGGIKVERELRAGRPVQMHTIDHTWIVDRSKQKLKGLTAALLTLSRQKGYVSRRDVISLFATFVQALDYEVPALCVKGTEGEVVFTGGIRMPLETLVHKAGDCDSQSVLFASLMGNVDNASVVLLSEGEKIQHAFIGVLGVPRPGDQSIKLKGQDYILIELATPKDNYRHIGRIPPEHWRKIKLFEVKRLI